MSNYIILLAVTLIALGGYVFPLQNDDTFSAGDFTNYDELQVTFLEVSDTASSTAQIGNIGNGVGTGCIILGDSAGATSSPVYITASGSTVSATTTKPAICSAPN